MNPTTFRFARRAPETVRRLHPDVIGGILCIHEYGGGW
jgi:hypothetical protein